MCLIQNMYRVFSPVILLLWVESLQSQPPTCLESGPVFYPPLAENLDLLLLRKTCSPRAAPPNLPHAEAPLTLGASRSPQQLSADAVHGRSDDDGAVLSPAHQLAWGWDVDGGRDLQRAFRLVTLHAPPGQRQHDTHSKGCVQGLQSQTHTARMCSGVAVTNTQQGCVQGLQSQTHSKDVFRGCSRKHA